MIITVRPGDQILLYKRKKINIAIITDISSSAEKRVRKKEIEKVCKHKVLKWEVKNL